MSSLFGVCFADIYRPTGLTIVRLAHHMKFVSFEREVPTRPSAIVGGAVDAGVGPATTPEH